MHSKTKHLNQIAFFLVIPGTPPPTTPAPTTPPTTTPPPGTTCDDDPCENGATCVMSGANFLCFCPDGFEGDLCEISKSFSNRKKKYL